MTNVAYKSTEFLALSYLRDYRDVLNCLQEFEKYENVNIRDFSKEC